MNSEPIEVLVNTEPLKVQNGHLSYSEIVLFAFGKLPEKLKFKPTVTFYRGLPENPEGILKLGDKVPVKLDMLFCASITGEG